MIVLLKPLRFIFFNSESANHTHTGQVFSGQPENGIQSPLHLPVPRNTPDHNTADDR